jgi:hypothetical protein
MEIIYDYTKIKEIVNQNLEYTVVGFTRSNLFNFTHEYLYTNSYETVTENRKLFGIVWDNSYDIEIFLGKEATPSSYDLDLLVKWFQDKGFEYLFIPDSSFIHNLLNDDVYKICLEDTEKIWSDESYYELVGNYNRKNAIEWLKLVLSRHYYMFSGKRKEKFFNRTHQLFAPDGTWGYIYKHFMEKYCNTISPIVPILRTPDGMVFDIIIETYYPKEIKVIFLELLPFFEEFRNDYNIKELERKIKNHLHKDKGQFFFFDKLEVFKNELTFDKYILKVCINGSTIRDNGRVDEYRMWEYDNGI